MVTYIFTRVLYCVIALTWICEIHRLTRLLLPTPLLPPFSPDPTALSPNTYNFLADEYDDPDCAESTGNQEVIPGDAVSAGFTGGECFLLETNNFLTECLEDGSVIVQTFGEDDTTCSGDVFFETSSVADTMNTCDSLMLDGHYYK